jgi:hypothetical protein
MVATRGVALNHIVGGLEQGCRPIPAEPGHQSRSVQHRLGWSIISKLYLNHGGCMPTKRPASLNVLAAAKLRCECALRVESGGRTPTVVCCAYVSPSVRCVSTIVRPMSSSGSDTVRPKRTSMARRTVHHCAPPQIEAMHGKFPNSEYGRTGTGVSPVLIVFAMILAGDRGLRALRRALKGPDWACNPAQA